MTEEMQDDKPRRTLTLRLDEGPWRAFKKWLIDHGLTFQEWGERKVDEELCPDSDWKERGEK